MLQAFSVFKYVDGYNFSVFVIKKHLKSGIFIKLYMKCKSHNKKNFLKLLFYQQQLGFLCVTYNR